MARINLRRLLDRERSARAAVLALLETLDADLAVEDAAGSTIAGTRAPGAPRRAIVQGESVLGYVVGDDGDALLTLLHYIVEQEAEKRALARDALEKYRELNLLYGFSEKVGASLDVRAVASVAVGEASRLIKAGNGFLLLRDPTGDCLRPLWGQEILAASVCQGEGILGRIAQGAIGEIVNDIAADSRRGSAEIGLASLLAAPLVTRGAAIGVLGIAATEMAAYAAADLKLLTAIASQAAPAIEAGLQYEQAMREAREREERLERQLAELHIEIDASRQSRQVAAIVGTDYFQRLREEADELRKGLR